MQQKKKAIRIIICVTLNFYFANKICIEISDKMKLTKDRNNSQPEI